MAKNYKHVITCQPNIAKHGKNCLQNEIASFGIALFYSVSFEDIRFMKINVIADACADILFYKNELTGDMGAEIAGPVALPTLSRFRPGYKYFGVRFLSGHSPLIANVGLSSIIGRYVPFAEICPNDGIIRRILSDWDYERQMRIFTDFYSDLYEKIKFSEKQELCDYIINKLSNSLEYTSLSALENDTGYSKQYINRIFKDKIGFSAMHFGKVMRIHNLLQTLPSLQARGALAQLSYDLGFSDQSHMIRDFKKYIGATPLQFLTSP
jgi:AraC-like DNA-binding protein